MQHGTEARVAAMRTEFLRLRRKAIAAEANSEVADMLGSAESAIGYAEYKLRLLREMLEPDPAA
jgi:hypothetical protein